MLDMYNKIDLCSDFLRDLLKVFLVLLFLYMHIDFITSRYTLIINSVFCMHVFCEVIVVNKGGESSLWSA